MKTILQIMGTRCGTNRGVVSNSKEVEVYDINNKHIRTFGSVRELEVKSEKYFGISIRAHRIRVHCKNEKLYKDKYYFKLKENYIF